MSLKEQFQEDIDIVLDDFGEPHTIDGQPDIICILDDKSIPNSVDGVYVVRRQLFVRESDLGYRPEPGQRMNFDNEYFYVVDCSGTGLLEITLEAHTS